MHNRNSPWEYWIVYTLYVYTWTYDSTNLRTCLLIRVPWNFDLKISNINNFHSTFSHDIVVLLVVFLIPILLLMEEIPSNHLACIKPCKYRAISYQPELVSLPDFRTMNSINSKYLENPPFTTNLGHLEWE